MLSHKKIAKHWRGLTNAGTIRARIEITDAQARSSESVVFLLDNLFILQRVY
jgi:hypothetical protein